MKKKNASLEKGGQRQGRACVAKLSFGFFGGPSTTRRGENPSSPDCQLAAAAELEFVKRSEGEEECMHGASRMGRAVAGRGNGIHIKLSEAPPPTRF